MIVLTEQQRKAVQQGELVAAIFEKQNVVLLRSDIYRRIRNVLDTERAVILAGHTRGPVEPPPPLEALAISAEDAAELADVVILPVARRAEIEELLLDDGVQTAWRTATGAAQSSWAQKNLS